jgi:hypothetical protein
MLLTSINIAQRTLVVTTRHVIAEVLLVHGLNYFPVVQLFEFGHVNTASTIKQSLHSLKL